MKILALALIRLKSAVPLLVGAESVNITLIVCRLIVVTAQA